jgi:hypothetical protein
MTVMAAAFTQTPSQAFPFPVESIKPRLGDSPPALDTSCALITPGIDGIKLDPYRARNGIDRLAWRAKSTATRDISELTDWSS